MCLYLHIKLFTVSKCTCLLWISIPKAKSFQFDTERFRTLKKRLEGPTYLCWNSLINMYKCTIYIYCFFSHAVKCIHLPFCILIWNDRFLVFLLQFFPGVFHGSIEWRVCPRAWASLHFLTISTDPFGQRYWWPNFSHVSRSQKMKNI